MRLGMNLFLWTTHVTAEHFPLFEKLRACGYEGVEIPTIRGDLAHYREVRRALDDCGLGWLMYDFAAGISFMEDHPQIPALKAAWVRGYRSERELSDDDEAEIETFVMLRRLALLAWIGSHPEVDTAQQLAPTFAPITAELADAFLSKMS